MPTLLCEGASLGELAVLKTSSRSSFFHHCYAIILIFLKWRENMISYSLWWVNDHTSLPINGLHLLGVRHITHLICMQLSAPSGPIFRWILPLVIKTYPLVQFSDRYLEVKWHSSVVKLLFNFDMKGINWPMTSYSLPVALTNEGRAYEEWCLRLVRSVYSKWLLCFLSTVKSCARER